MSKIVCTTPFPRLPSELPAEAIVVTPHDPAAAALLRPKVTLQHLARRRLSARGLSVADPRIAARLLREAISEVKPGADATAIAYRIRPILETILRVGVDTSALQHHGSAGAVEAARIAQSYRSKLRQRKLVDFVEIVWEAANTSPQEPGPPLFIYGYTRARKEEIEFIDRFAGDGSVYYLPVIDGNDAFKTNSDFAAQLATRGWSIEYDDVPAGSAGEKAAAKFVDILAEIPEGLAGFRLHDVAAEVRFVLSRVKRLLRSGTRAADIAVVARDLDLYAKEFALVGAEYGVPTRTSLKVPLSETLIGGFVSLLLSAVQRDFPFEETIRLLGHPLGPGMCDETWKRCRRERTEAFEAWAGLESSLDCLGYLRGAETKPSSEWVKCLRSVLAKFDVRGRAAHLAREIVAYNLLQEELSFIADEDEPMRFSELAAALRDVLANVRTNFDTSRLGVLITEPNFIVGGQFQHVFILGMAEGILPALPVDNPVIDFYERRSLAKEGIDFEEAADIPRWEQLSFFGVLSTATESLTLTYSATAGKEEKLQSSYFARLGIHPEPGTAEVLCSPAETLRNTLRKPYRGTDPVRAGAARQFAVEHRRESSEAWDEYDGVIGALIDIRGRKWSVSQLTALAGCGFKWFSKYALRLRPSDEMELDVSPATRGKLFHHALHQAVTSAADGTRENILKLLASGIDDGYASEDVAIPRVPNWELLREDYLASLTAAVNSNEFLPDGTAIVECEKEFLVRVHGLLISGRIDRIDRTPEGLAAVDYKTSSSKPSPVEDQEGRKLDLQVSVYLAALRELYPSETVSRGLYYSLPKGTAFEAELAEDDLLKEFLDAAVASLSDGKLAVRPVSANTCTYCDYDHLCRNGARILRKGAAS